MEYTRELEIVEEKNPSGFQRFLLVLLITAMLLGGAAYAAVYILLNGPSPYAGHRFVKAVGDHPVGGMLLKLYMTDAEIQAVLTAEDSAGRFSVFPNAE